jgi:photosystem II S4 domain protein
MAAPSTPRELPEGHPQRARLEPLVAAAASALRGWQPVWSGFLDADLREQAEAWLGDLSDLSLASWGGFAGAERRRLLLQPSEALAIDPVDTNQLSIGLAGLTISGNFLFDPAEAADFRAALAAAGAMTAELGDLWLRGDRGAQAVASSALAERLDGGSGLVRTVEVRFEARPLTELQPPAARPRRTISSVEASLRVDAVGSAGFGLSRSRMAEQIRQGAVRINWQTVTSPSRELVVGDRVQLDNRGELEIQSVDRTRRDRFRIQMERR